ncbi:MAG: hypothetical protein N2749_01535 [Clostridia bacterium]|nr:hypothetical protein [Clostridia bacterium]
MNTISFLKKNANRAKSSNELNKEIYYFVCSIENLGYNINVFAFKREKFIVMYACNDMLSKRWCQLINHTIFMCEEKFQLQQLQNFIISSTVAIYNSKLNVDTLNDKKVILIKEESVDNKVS